MGIIGDNSRGNPRRGAFTLVELLVVISVLAMLLGILLPALGLAREAGRRIHCASNLKTLTLAWTMYAFDNDDRICSADTKSGDGEWTWVQANKWSAGTERELSTGALWKYVSQIAEVYKCRSDKSDLIRSYSVARSMNGKVCSCEYDNFDNLWRWKRYTRISDPGAKIVFVDAQSREPWIEGSFNPIKDVDAVDLQWSTEENRNITSRHSGGCNTTFADGHGEYWKYKDPRTVSLAKWQINCLEASGDNEDIDYLVTTLKGSGYTNDQHFPYGYPYKGY